MSEASSSPIGIPQSTSPQGSLTLSLSPTWEVLQVNIYPISNLICIKILKNRYTLIRINSIAY